MAEPKATYAQMFLMAVKMSVGAGCLALPTMLHQCGAIEAGALFLLIGGAMRWSMHALLRVKTYAERRGRRVDALSDLGYELAGGEVGRRTVEFVTVGFQLGVCCVYYAFAAELLADVTPRGDRGATRGQWVCFLVPLVAVPCCLRHLRDLGDVAKVATLLFVGAWVGTIGVCAARITRDGPAAVLAGPRSRYSIVRAFATVTYAFEGIPSSLCQIANALDEPDRADELVRSAIATTVAVYCLTAFLGAFAFSKPENPATLSLLAEPGPGPIAVNVLVTAAVVLTYPLQFYPAISLLERAAGVGPGARAAKGRPPVRRRKSGDRDGDTSSDSEDDADYEAAALLHGGDDPSYGGGSGGQSRVSGASTSIWIHEADGGAAAVGFRLAFVVGTAAVAILVADLTRLIELVGIVFAPALAFIFPNLFDLVAARRSPSDYPRTKLELAVSTAILACTVLACTVGTTQQLVDFLRQPA